jgi:hypothetical protein
LSYDQLPMNRRILSPFLLVQLLFASQQYAGAEDIQHLELREPIDTTGTTPIPNKTGADGMGGLSAPGADAIMTPNMLLVSPQAAGKKPPEPLQAYVGSYLKMQVDRYDVTFDRLQGILITVINETNRPLVVNGNKAEALIGGKSYVAVPVTTLQTIVIPAHNASQVLEDILTKIMPAAATIGAVPTIKDFNSLKKPVLERYGADELRRRVEASRFGRRILWPQEKSSAVLYFDTAVDLNNCSVQIPASTLFDQQDKSMLTSSPGTSAPSTSAPATSSPATSLQTITLPTTSSPTTSRP